MADTILPELPKTPTGITGLDEVTYGGLPTGRPTLVCGAAGCGKTLMAVEFLVRGVTEFNEPGVFLAFEESASELSQNVASLGFDLQELIAAKKLVVDHVRVERSEIEHTGDYDLEGLFVRLGYAIDSIGAKRVVLDTLETLFGGLGDTAILRAELRRLFRWLKDKGVTAIITAERGEGTLTRQGLEEYVSDCVILLDHRVENQLSIRRMRIVKYRGSPHDTNEFPFLICDGGISVLPLTSVGKLEHSASSERVSTGIERLDEMLSSGYYRGSSVLISGSAGTGKSTFAALFAAACCRYNDRCIYFAFEESRAEILRNMKSIGLDLGPCVDSDLLHFHTSRPTLFGLETHLARMYSVIDELKPVAVVIDPITTFLGSGSGSDVKSLLVRLFDLLKSRGITAVVTALHSPDENMESSGVDVSSLIDTVLLIRNPESQGERNRVLSIVKSRGTAHSNQMREFQISDNGVSLLDVYPGPGDIVTGSARRAQEAGIAVQMRERKRAAANRQREMDRKRDLFEAQMKVLQKQFEAELNEYEFVAGSETGLADEVDEQGRNGKKP